MRAARSWQHHLLTGVVLPLSGARRRNGLLHLPELLDAEAERREPELTARELAGVRAVRREHRGWSVWEYAADGWAPGAPVVVALHGGAHVRAVSRRHLRWCADLARSTGARFVVPFRPSAPRATAETVVPAVAALLRATVEQHPCARVTVVGVSAGGGVATAAVQLLVATGRRLPDQLVLVSPWLDAAVPATAGSPPRDPLLDPEQLRECGRLWAGSRPLDDPLVSPVHGSVRWLPPTTVFTGTADVLHPDSLRLARRALEAGAPLELVVREGLVHGWATLTMTPEGLEGTARIHELVTGCAGADRDAVRAG